MTKAREEDIARVEEIVGATLAPWLRERLLADNGFVLDDTAGTTGRKWQILPVMDRSNRKTQTRTARDIARATAEARLVDVVSSPGFGEPQPGTPFPPDAVVIGTGWSPLERLALLPDPHHPGQLGSMLYRQMQFSPMTCLNVTLEEFAPDPLSFDTGQALPEFRYHPDPESTGSIVRSGVTCSLCGRARGWVYRGSAYGIGDRSSKVCPWCIADGSAAATGTSFNDSYPLIDAGIAPEIAHQVSACTPGFSSFQEVWWESCHNDACAFVGALTADQMLRIPASERAELHLSDEMIEELRGHEFESDYAVFGFECLHCSTMHGVADMS